MHNRFPQNNFSFIPTYDIDIAWAYKYRGFKLHAGNIVRSLVKGQWRAARARIKTANGREQDPYDAYEWMDALHQRFNLHPIYFFLIAEIKGIYDKNTGITVPQFKELIKNISIHYEIGIHPSWYSGDYPTSIQKEKKWLENISGKLVTKSRQHYLRFTLPHTFQRLISAGIKDEYSMGYGSINGFRASIASSFYWYDLEKEETTSLLLHPFCFMDANSFFEQKFTPEQSLEEVLGYYKSIKDVDGTMITLWHNNILGTDEEFTGWSEVYKQFVEKVCSESF